MQSQLEKINDEKLITAVADDIDDLDDDDGDEIPQLLHEVNESRRMSMARRFSTQGRRSSFIANIDPDETVPKTERFVAFPSLQFNLLSPT